MKKILLFVTLTAVAYAAPQTGTPYPVQYAGNPAQHSTAPAFHAALGAVAAGMPAPPVAKRHYTAVGAAIHHAAGSPFEPELDLRRLMVGNQAGVVKILGAHRMGVSHARCLDERSQARMDEAARGEIFKALRLQPGSLPARGGRQAAGTLEHTARYLMSNYQFLPHKETVALLGVMGGSVHLSPATRDSVHRFLIGAMENDSDVAVRRQSILALAVQPEVTPAIVEKVLQIYERSENLWETFPVQQFFEYHAAEVRQLKNFPQLRQRIAQVNSLYTANVLGFLDSAQ